MSRQAYNSKFSKGYRAVAAVLLFLSGCVPALDKNPVPSAHRIFDEGLIGEWISGDKEEIEVRKKGEGYEIIVASRGTLFEFLAVSGSVGDLDLIAIDLSSVKRSENKRGSDEIAPQGQAAFLTFLYSFRSDSKLELTPLDMQLIWDGIESGEIDGIVDDDCFEINEAISNGKDSIGDLRNYSNFNAGFLCPAIDLSPDVLEGLLLSEKSSIFSTDDALILHRQITTR